MPRISRRQLFQFAGSTLATLGLSQLHFRQQADLYGKVLAASTSCKLALLVGINTYPDKPLTGCANDVASQYYLLVYRFGFAPQDITTPGISRSGGNDERYYGTYSVSADVGIADGERNFGPSV